MAVLTKAERIRENAIVAVGGALLSVSRMKQQPSLAECQEMATRIVDNVTEHAVETVRALIDAEEGKPG